MIASNSIEGFVQNHAGLMWRRAVRRANIASYLDFEIDDDDAESYAAHNYVSVYRVASADDAIRFRLPRRALVVVGVIGNEDLARMIPQT